MKFQQREVEFLFLESNWNRFRRIIANPPLILSIVLLILLIYLVIAPLFSMVESSLTLSSRDSIYVVGEQVGDFTNYYLKRTFVGNMSDILFYQPLRNTLMVSFAMSILALFIGSILAWLVVRTDLLFKQIIANLAIIPYVLPSWTLALAWITVFKNRRLGGASGMLEYLGIDLPDWISFGPIPIIIVMALHYYPFTFLLIGSALRSLDPTLEEAALVLGANRRVAIRRIVFALITPAIFSAWLLTISRGIGTFAAPSFLGLPVNYHLLSTKLYSNLLTGSPGVSYIIAVVMIAVSSLFIFLNQRIIGKRKSYVTVTGKAFQPKLVALKKWRYLVTSLVIIFLILVVFLPIFVLGIDTVMKVAGNYSFSNFTLHSWLGKSDPNIAYGEPGILRNPYVLGALWNSIKLGVSVAFFCGISGLLIGYTVVRLRGSKLSTILDQISFFPYLIPSIAFGAIYLSLFAQPRGFIPSLYGTFTLLVLVTTVKNLPFATRAGISGMMQLGHEIEEAGIIAGASWFTRMRRLIFPLQSSNITSGMQLPLITAMRELSLLLILITPNTRLLTTVTFRYTDYANYSMANAVLLLNIFIVLAMIYLLKKFTGSDLTKGLGGQ